MNVRSLRGWLAMLLIVLPILSGCTMEPDRVTRENYDRVRAWMSFDEAVEVLGQPATEAKWLGLRQYTWVEKDRHIHIKFLANRAVYFSSKNLEAVRPGSRKTAGR